MSKQKQEQRVSEPTIRGPRPGGMMRHSMMQEKAELIHPRSTLWRWMLSYIQPFIKKYALYLILLLITTVITAYLPVLSSLIKGSLPVIAKLS